MSKTVEGPKVLVPFMQSMIPWQLRLRLDATNVLVQDAQLRQMLPRYAMPGEFPVLKILLEHLPSTLLPKEAWAAWQHLAPGS